MDLFIRQANEADIPLILPIWAQFMAFLQERNPDYWALTGGEGAFGQHLQSSIAEANTLVSVAELDGLIAGFCLAYIERLPEWFGAEKIGLIRYLAVANDHQSQGIGQELVVNTLDWFDTKEIERVEVFVLNGIPASRFWDKMGFKPFMDRRFRLI